MYTAKQIYIAFRKMCFSRGYTRKVVGDDRYEVPLKFKIGHSCKLWGTKESGKFMEIYDTKKKKRELVLTEHWI